MLQKAGLKLVEALEKKYGPLILVIIAVTIFAGLQYMERLDNKKFYREQQVQWFTKSEAQAEKYINKFAQVVESTTETAKATNKVLNELKTSVDILAERIR